MYVYKCMYNQTHTEQDKNSIGLNNELTKKEGKNNYYNNKNIRNVDVACEKQGMSGMGNKHAC